MAEENKLVLFLRICVVSVLYMTTVLVIGYGVKSLFSSDELLSVVRENGVTPSLEVKGSPGLNQSTSLCERIHIHGFPRSVKQMMSKYTHSLEIIVNASAAGNTSSIHVCFHRNSSLAVGMCPHYGWETIIDGLWTATMSPFDRKLLDVRVVASSSSNVTLQVSTLQGSFMYRINYLIVGTVLMTWASTLSTSYAFYCTCCFTVGLLLFFLLLLFQGVRRLPTRPSFSALFVYSSLLGLTYVSLPYIPGFFQDFLRALVGFEDRYGEPELVLLQWLGVLFGFVAVNTQLLLAPDDSIDISTSLFISWSISILAAVLILQSSGDALLAGGAVVFVIVMSPMLRKITALIFPPRVREFLVYLVLQMQKGLVYVAGPTATIGARQIMFYRGRFCDLY